MNKLIEGYLSHGSISLRILMLFMLTVVLVGCAMSPEFVRKNIPNKGTLIISAKRPLVASCISQQLRQKIKAVSLYKVIESEDSVVLMSGSFPVRMYDLEDSVGGTMVTLFYSAPYKKETLSVIDDCRGQLESLKSQPQNPTN